jgi:hypothetical protein
MTKIHSDSAYTCHIGTTIDVQPHAAFAGILWRIRMMKAGMNVIESSESSRIFDLSVRPAKTKDSGLTPSPIISPCIMLLDDKRTKLMLRDSWC